MIPQMWFQAACERIRPYTRVTPLTYDPRLDVYLKWENQQITGSFKVRGALNKVLALQPWELEQGLVTASAGNHGQGVAFAAQLAGARVKVFASDHAVPKKVAAMQALGAEVVLVNGGYAEAETTAIQYAQETSSTWVSPYNDGQVIAGQGTIAIEIAEQLAQKAVKSIVCPVGGGGLISGVGLVSHGWDPAPEVIGVQSEASPFMHGLFTRGTQKGLEDLPSLADGLAGALETGSITVPMVRQAVSRMILVTEDEIARAIVYAWQQYGQVIEGSAAVCLAAALFRTDIPRPAALILSGGNIQPEIHAGLLEKFAARKGEARS